MRGDPPEAFMQVGIFLAGTVVGTVITILLMTMALGLGK